MTDASSAPPTTPSSGVERAPSPGPAAPDGSACPVKPAGRRPPLSLPGLALAFVAGAGVRALIAPSIASSATVLALSGLAGAVGYWIGAKLFGAG